LARYNLNHHRYHLSCLCHDYHHPNEYDVLVDQDTAAAVFDFRGLFVACAVSYTWIYLCWSKVDHFLLIDHRQNLAEATLFFLPSVVHCAAVDNFDELTAAHVAGN